MRLNGIDPKGINMVELSCFPPTAGTCWKHYGLYYAGGKPSVKRVFEELVENFNFDKVNYPQIKRSVSEALKRG